MSAAMFDHFRYIQTGHSGPLAPPSRQVALASQDNQSLNKQNKNTAYE